MHYQTNEAEHFVKLNGPVILILGVFEYSIGGCYMNPEYHP